MSNKSVADVQELKTRHLNNIETRTKSARDVQGARQALQTRQSMLTKLQGEVGQKDAIDILVGGFKF